MGKSINCLSLVLLTLLALLVAACEPVAPDVATAAPPAILYPTYTPEPTETRVGTRMTAIPQLAVATSLAPSISSQDLAVQRALEFLRGQYVPKVGLLRESPEVAPHRFWLATDNMLAAHAFAVSGEEDWAAILLSSFSSYGVTMSNGLIEVLWGIPVSWPPSTERPTLMARIGEDGVWHEFRDGESQFADWEEYANLALLGALNEHLLGQEDVALEIFEEASKQFDGLGFADKAYRDAHGYYETYKLALALYVGNEIGASVPVGVKEVLLRRQANSGGFYTLYDAEGSVGDPNTETTSLAVLALMLKEGE